MDGAGSDPVDLTTQHVREAVRGDATSVTWLVERFSPLLLAQASHRLRGGVGALTRVHSAEDLVQDVWLRALPRLAGLAARDGRITPVVMRFLATTLLNRLNSLAQTHLRADGAGRQEALGDAAHDRFAAESTRIVTGIVRRERIDAVRSAIEALDESDRAVVVLRGIEQNTVADVAVLLAEKPNTISVKYRRALDRLRAHLPGSIFDEFVDADSIPNT